MSTLNWRTATHVVLNDTLIPDPNAGHNLLGQLRNVRVAVEEASSTSTPDSPRTPTPQPGRSSTCTSCQRPLSTPSPTGTLSGVPDGSQASDSHHRGNDCTPPGREAERGCIYVRGSHRGLAGAGSTARRSSLGRLARNRPMRAATTSTRAHLSATLNPAPLSPPLTRPPRRATHELRKLRRSSQPRPRRVLDLLQPMRLVLQRTRTHHHPRDHHHPVPRLRRRSPRPRRPIRVRAVRLVKPLGGRPPATPHRGKSALSPAAPTLSACRSRTVARQSPHPDVQRGLGVINPAASRRGPTIRLRSSRYAAACRRARSAPAPAPA